MENRNAVIYARYSSTNQRDASIEQQVAACMRYAETAGLNIVHVYDDHAISGTTDDRPQFQLMLKDAAVGAWSYVIVYALDRFSRDRYDSAIHKHTLKEYGVKVVSATEPISDDPAGVLMESVLEGFAEYYSKELSAKIRRGYRNNAEHRLVIGPPPLGYKRGPDKKYMIDDKTAPIVREVFQRVDSGEMLICIIDDLNGRGIKTSYGHAWNKNSFSKMLSNEKYIGMYVYEDIRDEAGIPPIIDKALYYRVQNYLAKKPKARGGVQPRRTDHNMYHLTGKLHCALCGEYMTGIAGTSKTQAMYYYYECKGHRAHKCTLPAIRQDAIEGLIADAIRDICLDDEMIQWLAKKVVEAEKAAAPVEEIAAIEAQLKECRTQKQNLTNAILQGLFTQTIKDTMEQLEKKEADLSARLLIAQDKAKVRFDEYDVRALFEAYRDGECGTSFGNSTLLDAFLIEAHVSEKEIRCVLSYTGGQKDVSLPFDVVHADLSTSEKRTLKASAPRSNGGKSSYKDKKWSPEGFIRTLHIYGAAVMLVFSFV